MRTMRSISRCQARSRGASSPGNRGCSPPAVAAARAGAPSAVGSCRLASLPGTVRHRSLNTCSSCSRRSRSRCSSVRRSVRARRRIAVHAVAHQRVGGVEHALDRGRAVALLALRDVVSGEFQIVQDAVGVGPLLEQIVVLEEMVMAERRVRDHQRLHRHGVLLHDVADAGVGVDHDLIGEALHARAVHRLVAGEVLAERPVLVEQRHADRRIGVEHLLGADHLDLVRIDVEPQFVDRDLLDRVVMRWMVSKSQSAPSNSRRSALIGRVAHALAASAPVFLANSSRNTG